MLWNELHPLDAEFWKDTQTLGIDDSLVSVPSIRPNKIRERLQKLGALVPTFAAFCDPAGVGPAACITAGSSLFVAATHMQKALLDPYYKGYYGPYFIHVVEISGEVNTGIKEDLRLPHQKSVQLRSHGLTARIVHHLAEIDPLSIALDGNPMKPFCDFFKKMSDQEFDHMRAMDSYYEGAPTLKRNLEISLQKSTANHTINIPCRSRAGPLCEELFYKARFSSNFSELSSRPLN